MKIKLTVKDPTGGEPWTEELDSPACTLEDAEAYGRRLVDDFNREERERYGDRAIGYREFVACSLSGELNQRHDWRKTNLVTQRGRDGLFDSFRCHRCGVTGKRYTLGGGVFRDSRYQAEKYNTCRGPEVSE